MAVSALSSSSLSADLLSTISMQTSSEWHSQQGSLITAFNQLHRWRVLFRPYCFEFVFCVSTGQIHWQSWALHLSHFTGRLDCYLSSTSVKRMIIPKTTRSLIKPAVWSILGVMMAMQRFYQWGIVLSGQSPQTLYWFEKMPVLFPLRGECPWKFKSLIWQGVTVATAANRLFNGLSDITCGPRHPSGCRCLHF